MMALASRSRSQNILVVHGRDRRRRRRSRFWRGHRCHTQHGLIALPHGRLTHRGHEAFADPLRVSRHVLSVATPVAVFHANHVPERHPICRHNHLSQHPLAPRLAVHLHAVADLQPFATPQLERGGRLWRLLLPLLFSRAMRGRGHRSGSRGSDKNHLPGRRSRSGRTRSTATGWWDDTTSTGCCHRCSWCTRRNCCALPRTRCNRRRFKKRRRRLEG
mmetsp:Transcript_13084/g.31977  ORF Transcript_13084/g.31977 Transcript_13084/m.31977 type:complete len:218 (-) Transcript_13084:1156-1809(-)